MRTFTRTIPMLLAGALVALALAGQGGARSAALVKCSTTILPRDASGRVINLTGRWQANDGTYSLLQIGSCLWWGGGQTRSNVFFGTVSSSSVDGEWADVFRGTSGKLTLLIRSSTSLLRRSSTGAFPATSWKKTA